MTKDQSNLGDCSTGKCSTMSLLIAASAERDEVGLSGERAGLPGLLREML